MTGFDAVVTDLDGTVIRGDGTVIEATLYAARIQTIGVAPQRMIAFGDMPIDIAMFSVVGHSVAMGNAPEEVRKAATSQTASVEDDGFARVLSDLDLVPRSAGSSGE